MDDLIWRFLQNNTSAEEDRALEQWRSALTANERHFQELRRLWAASAHVRPVTRRPTAATIIAAHPGRRLRRWNRAVMAAAVVGALLLGTRAVRWQASPEPVVASTEIVTGADELSTVRLGDGTVVRLAPSSRLVLPHGPNAREVWLYGRAYFAVTSDPQRRFTVHTERGVATVLGTRFDLRSEGQQLRLMVIEGKVQLNADGRTVAVGAHRLAEIGTGRAAAVAEVDHDYIQQTLGWAGNFLAFESTPLKDAARELSSHYSVPITIADSALANQTVTGWFADEPFESVFMIICRAVRAECAVRNSGATIAP
jgi:transmembrane sensor